MKCDNCSTVINPTFAYAIKNNLCPACGSGIMTPQRLGVFVSLSSLFDENKDVLGNAEGIVNLIMENFDLTQRFRKVELSNVVATPLVQKPDPLPPQKDAYKVEAPSKKDAYKVVPPVQKEPEEFVSEDLDEEERAMLSAMLAAQKSPNPKAMGKNTTTPTEESMFDGSVEYERILNEKKSDTLQKITSGAPGSASFRRT